MCYSLTRLDKSGRFRVLRPARTRIFIDFLDASRQLRIRLGDAHALRTIADFHNLITGCNFADFQVEPGR